MPESSQDPSNIQPETAPQEQLSAVDKDSIAPRHAKEVTPEQKKKKRTVIALSVLLAVLLCGAAAFGITYYLQQQELARAAEELANTPVPEVTEPEPTEEADPRVNNPIDFITLKQENADVYAWIYVPGTNVNYPVLQSATDDSFYLDHNRYGEEAIEGSVFSEMANATDFSDPVTVLYAHVARGSESQIMFETLHNFEDADFFAANDTFYIYTPGHILTYHIVSAYQYDDRHILNSYDFTNPQVLQSYLSFVQNPDSLLVNARNDTPLTTESKIVQLSTCMVSASQPNNRYLVSGVLVDDQPTY